jgi:hypothetical protein
MPIGPHALCAGGERFIKVPLSSGATGRTLGGRQRKIGWFRSVANAGCAIRCWCVSSPTFLCESAASVDKFQAVALCTGWERPPHILLSGRIDTVSRMVGARQIMLM